MSNKHSLSHISSPSDKYEGDENPERRRNLNILNQNDSSSKNFVHNRDIISNIGTASTDISMLTTYKRMRRVIYCLPLIVRFHVHLE